jgi:hypothetical protein
MLDPRAIGHLKAIDRKHHGLIRRTLHEQLGFDPGVPTRNRKLLYGPIAWGARWELRFGPGNCFRALYEINEQDRTVRIVAIGIKEGGRLRFGGKEARP